jgi:hypothetical protein
MKIAIKYYLLCLIVLAVGCSKNDTIENPDPVIAEYKEEIISIHAPSLKSSIAVVDTIQKAKVLLPPYYKNDSSKHYPVVYFIHGFSASYQTDYGIFRAAYDGMVAGNIEAFIIVTVNSECSLGGTFSVNSPVTGNWENHLTKEVIDYMDANYRTIPEKKSRGIAGFSMGGFGALYLGLRHADIYNLVYAISPGVLKNEDFRGAYNIWLADGGSFISAYGAAFSPNLELSYPYAEKPIFNGTVEDNLIIENWKNGFGNFDIKVSEYLAGNNRLKQIGLDYGLAEYYNWIPKGCIYLAGIFDSKGIPYEKHPRPNGAHEVNIEQVKTYMLPFFSKNLSFK